MPSSVPKHQCCSIQRWIFIRSSSKNCLTLFLHVHVLPTVPHMLSDYAPPTQSCPPPCPPTPFLSRLPPPHTWIRKRLNNNQKWRILSTWSTLSIRVEWNMCFCLYTNKPEHRCGSHQWGRKHDYPIFFLWAVTLKIVFLRFLSKEGLPLIKNSFTPYKSLHLSVWIARH